MSDFELYKYYEEYDTEIQDYTHFLAVRNLMITRGLLTGDIYNLNNFNFDEFFGFDKKYYSKEYTWYCSKDLGLLN